MTHERWKCEVSEALQRCPLLDNGSIDTFPQQRKSEQCYEINTLSRSNGQALNKEELSEVVTYIRFSPKFCKGSYNNAFGRK
jgi:hypothetical protein